MRDPNHPKRQNTAKLLKEKAGIVTQKEKEAVLHRAQAQQARNAKLKEKTKGTTGASYDLWGEKGSHFIEKIILQLKNPRLT